MREIVFDTETTGLDSRADRIIELGAVELFNRFPTGRTFHEYINPEGREVHPEALAIHGISNTDLVGKPVFSEIAERFTAFIDGAMLVAHNANFDIGFVNAELGRVGRDFIGPDRIVDTLAIARRRHPMGPNSLDALCRRYGIDNSRRLKHGALLDAELLAEVYIELIGGKQAALGLETERAAETGPVADREAPIVLGARPAPLPSRLTPAELEAHLRMVERIGEKALWRNFDPQA